jgi:hypothetical protein
MHRFALLPLIVAIIVLTVSAQPQPPDSPLGDHVLSAGSGLSRGSEGFASLYGELKYIPNIVGLQICP